MRRLVLTIILVCFMLAVWPLILDFGGVLDDKLINNSSAQPYSTDQADCKQPKFVFLIGIEGSGHHLYQTLVSESPAFRDLLEDEVDLLELQRLLFDNKHKHKSLWGIPFTSREGDAEQVLQNVSTILKRLDKQTNWTIPINGAEPDTESYDVGALSYPTHSWKHELKYPDVGLLYHACDAAGVSCQHIYISREPYEVISSTVRRGFHDLRISPHLYTTMLAAIYAQLHEFPSRTAACWRYGDEQDAWYVGNLLGWKSRREFHRDYRRIYQDRPDKHIESIFPRNLKPYMQSMIRTDKLVMDSCRSIVEERKCL